MCAVPTHAFTVGLFDCTFNMALPNNGIWKGNVVGETPTSDGKMIKMHGKVKYT